MAASRPESTPQAGGSALGRPPPPVAPKELTFGEYFSGKLRKLGEQHAATVTDAAGGGAVFRGVSVWLDGRLDPPEDVIKLLIVQGGGTIQHVLTATHTTHIIASNLPDSKIKEIRSHKVWRPVVRPAWVVDSARSGRLLPTLPYILEAFAPAARLAFGAGGAVAAPAPRRPAGAAAAAAPRSPAAVAPLDRRPPEPPRAIPSATGQQTAPAPPPPPPALLPQLSAGADPRFLKRYNASSRLHYLGTARAERQGQVAAAILRHAATAAERPPGGPDSCGALADPAAGTEEGAMPWPRVIAHVDIDCFFAQVALLARPDLQSHPVAVAHSGSAPPPPRPQQTGVAPAAAAAEAAKRPDPAQAADHPALRGGPDQNGDVESGNESDATVALDLDDEPGGAAARAGPSAPAACSAHAGGLIAAPPSAPRGSGARPVVLRTGAVGSAAEGSGSSSGGYAGEISSANYVARGFGVRAGMGVTRARTLCPDLIVLPYDFPRIEAVSMAVYDEFLRVTLRVQAVSCDEAYLDLTGIPRPAAVLERLRASILARCGVTVSAGLGPNLLLARLATSRAKPDGLFVVPAGAEAQQALLDALPAADLPGVGYRCAELLTTHGIENVAQLRVTPAPQLRAWLGASLGDRLAQYARGVDNRAVVIIRPRKSIGLDATWGVRFSDAAQITTFLQQLVGELVKRMHEAGAEAGALAAASAAVVAAGGVALQPPAATVPFRARTLTLTVLRRKPDAPAPGKSMGHGICDSLSRSRRWQAAPVCNAEVFSAAALALFREIDRELVCPPSEVRGFSLRAGDLSHPLQVEDDGDEDGEGGAGSAAVLRLFLQRGTAAAGAAGAAWAAGALEAAAPIASGAPDRSSSRQRDAPRGYADPPSANDRKDGVASSASVAAPRVSAAVLRGPMRPGARHLQMGLAFGAAPLTSAAASRAPTAAMAKRPRAAGDVPSIHSFASVAPISLLTQDESRAPVPMDAPVSNAVVNLADSASPRATGDSDVEDVTAAVTASSASAAIPRASSLAAAGTRAEHSTAPQPPRSRGWGAVTGAVAPGRSSHPHSLRQATLSNSAASDDRSRAALRDRDAVSATLRAAGFDAAFFWALPEEEQLSVLRQAQSKRARTATGIGAGMSGVAAAAAAAAAAAPPKTPAQIAPHPRAAAASSPRGPAAAVVLLLDDSQDVRVDVCDSPKQQVPVMQTDGATVAREDGDALAPSSTGLPPFSSSGGWMAGLRTWMLAIGPFPAPRDARALVDRAVECVMTHGAEHAATLLRCLRRHCAAIEAERVRMAAAPGAEPEAEEAYRRGGSVPGDATARGGGRATWADVEAAVAEAVDGAARESFGAAVLWD